MNNVLVVGRDRKRHLSLLQFAEHLAMSEHGRNGWLIKMDWVEHELGIIGFAPLPFRPYDFVNVDVENLVIRVSPADGDVMELLLMGAFTKLGSF